MAFYLNCKIKHQRSDVFSEPGWQDWHRARALQARPRRGRGRRRPRHEGARLCDGERLPAVRLGGGAGALPAGRAQLPKSKLKLFLLTEGYKVRIRTLLLPLASTEWIKQHKTLQRTNRRPRGAGGRDGDRRPRCGGRHCGHCCPVGLDSWGHKRLTTAPYA